MDKRFKYSFIVLSIVICLPIFQQSTGWLSKGKLHGYFVKAKYDNIETKTWFSGEFQVKFEKYINEQVGFRPFLVKLRNQIEYSVNGNAKAAGVLIGKEEYLFEENYIKAYKGMDFLGDSIIEEKSRKLKMLQDTLQQMGKYLLTVIAPGKGSFYPEKFPENYDAIPNSRTNYATYCECFNKNKTNYIDFNKWFLQMKDTSTYMLYPKYGIHWSHYGMHLALDSMNRKIEKDLQIQLPRMKMNDIELTTSLRKDDYDIGKSLNLLFQLESPEMAYPQISWEKNEDTYKPKAIIVADSFFWSMFGIGAQHEVFNDGKFWYYNQQVYPDFWGKGTTTDQLNLNEELQKTELVIIICNESNLYKFAYDFIDQAYEAFY